MTKATSEYLNRPLRTEAQARADILRKEARREDARANYVCAQMFRDLADYYERTVT